MSNYYSRSSGSYKNYLVERSNDKIAEQIKKSSREQQETTAILSAICTARINKTVRSMETGIKQSLNKNTCATVVSANMLNSTMGKGFDSLNLTLDMGFGGIEEAIGKMTAAMNAGFEKVCTKIDTWGNEICNKLDQIHDIVNNPLLTASRELYRRAKRNAEKEFFEEALEDIKAAVEKNVTDYMSWGLMGKIYLFGLSEFSNVVDVLKAIESFTNACKYVKPDIDEIDEARKIASEFYFYLAYANYVMSNEKKLSSESNEIGNAESKTYLEESARLNAKSYSLSDEMYEALYNQSRAECLLGNTQKALESVKKCIRLDGLYAIKSTTDYDLSALRTDIENFIISERDRLFPDAQNILKTLNNYVFVGGEFSDRCTQFINKFGVISMDSPYLDIRLCVDEWNEIKLPFEKNEFPIDEKVLSRKQKFDLYDSLPSVFDYRLKGAIYVNHGEEFFGIKKDAYSYTHFYLYSYTPCKPGRWLRLPVWIYAKEFCREFNKEIPYLTVEDDEPNVGILEKPAFLIDLLKYKKSEKQIEYDENTMFYFDVKEIDEDSYSYSYLFEIWQKGVYTREAFESLEKKSEELNKLFDEFSTFYNKKEDERMREESERERKNKKFENIVFAVISVAVVLGVLIGCFAFCHSF